MPSIGKLIIYLHFAFFFEFLYSGHKTPATYKNEVLKSV